MTIEDYRKMFPYNCISETMKPVRKMGKLEIWHKRYSDWKIRHFKDLMRIKNGLKPLYFLGDEVTKSKLEYDYFIDGQKEELEVIAEELGIQPNSVIGSLYKNNDKILRKGLTITRVKKDEQ